LKRNETGTPAMMKLTLNCAPQHSWKSVVAAK
jgi:hypothetical protein